MTRFIFDATTTINGWIADEQNSLAWLFAVPGGTEPDPELVPQSATVMVEGSTTYEWMLAELDLIQRPEKWTTFSQGRPTFVFTTRELPVPEGADVRFVRGLVGDTLAVIQDAAGDGDVWLVGGGELVGQFFDAGALDEVALSIAPVALGSGAPLLPRRIGDGRSAALPGITSPLPREGIHRRRPRRVTNRRARPACRRPTGPGRPAGELPPLQPPWW